MYGSSHVDAALHFAQLIFLFENSTRTLHIHSCTNQGGNERERDREKGFIVKEFPNETEILSGFASSILYFHFRVYINQL